MNVNLTIKVASTMENFLLLTLEGYSWERNNNPFKLQAGKWAASWSSFPLDSDEILDFAIVAKGNRGVECTVDITMKKGNKTVKHPQIKEKFNNKGWLIITDTIIF